MNQIKVRTRIAHFLIMAGVTSKMMACRGSVFESTVTDKPSSPIDPIAATDSAAVAKSQIIERLIIKPKSLSQSDGRALSIEIRSESEIWCERRCSQFSLLDERTGTDSVRLSAVKKTMVGNTTPGVLEVQKDFEALGHGRKKLEIMHVGVKDEKVSIYVDEFNAERPNFYALPMILSRVVLRGLHVYKARFDDRDVELLLDSGCVWPDLRQSQSLPQAFVMGVYFEERANRLGQKGVFVAKNIIYPWPH